MMRPHSSASPGATGLIVISISLLCDSSSASVRRVQRTDERRIRRVRQLSHSLFDDSPVLEDQLARNLTRAHLEDVQQPYLELRPDGRGRVQDAVAREHDPRDAVVHDALFRSESLKATELFDLKRVEHAPVRSEERRVGKEGRARW